MFLFIESGPFLSAAIRELNLGSPNAGGDLFNMSLLSFFIGFMCGVVFEAVWIVHLAHTGDFHPR